MTTALLNFINSQNNTYKVYHENGVYMGDLVVGVDGFYVYWPARSDGYWDSHTMRKIADKIDELDKPWQDNINEYFEQHREGILSADQEEKTPVAVENGQRQNSVVL